jgi:hypothetical protein
MTCWRSRLLAACDLRSQVAFWTVYNMVSQSYTRIDSKQYLKTVYLFESPQNSLDMRLKVNGT